MIRYAFLAGALLALSDSSEAALKPQYYTSFKGVSCDGPSACFAKFERIPAGKTLVVSHAACRVRLFPASALPDQFMLRDNAEVDVQPVAAPVGSTTEYADFTLAVDGEVFFPSKVRPHFYLYALADGNPVTKTVMECSLTGRLE